MNGRIMLRSHTMMPRYHNDAQIRRDHDTRFNDDDRDDVDDEVRNNSGFGYRIEVRGNNNIQWLKLFFLFHLPFGRTGRFFSLDSRIPGR